jgi:hypothetical protein
MTKTGDFTNYCPSRAGSGCWCNWDITTVRIQSRPTTRWKPLKSQSLRTRCRSLRNCSRPNYRMHLYRILHHFSSADFSHSVSNSARHRMGNCRHLVGRGVFRRANDPGSTRWFPTDATSIGTLTLHRCFACPYGCQRGALRYRWLCTCSKGSTGHGLANVLRFTSDALPFHGGLGAHTASYGAAFIGGVVLCVLTYRRRLRLEFADRRHQ